MQRRDLPRADAAPGQRQRRIYDWAELMSLVRRITASKGTFLLALVLGTVTGSAFVSGGLAPHHIVARFRNVDGLVTGNEVRIAGVKAGHVESVGVGTDGHGQQFAEAKLTIDATAWPLRQGTLVAVRPRGVLSEVYVDLTPGSPSSAALPDGFTYQVANTGSPTNLDDVTNVFNANVRTAIRTQLQEGVIAFGNGGAANLNSTIGNLRPLLLDAVPVTDVLASRIVQLDRLNFEFDKISGELAREDARLRTLIVDSNTTFHALAVSEQHLQGTLVHAQGTLQSIDAGLRGEEPNLKAIFEKGPEALSDLKAAADLLTPLIKAVNPHVASLDQLLTEFVTATGFNTGTGGIDTLRVNGTLPPPNRSAIECGGVPLEQGNCGGTNGGSGG